MSRRIARFRAAALATAVLAFAACDTTNSLNPETSAPETAPQPVAGGDAMSMSVAYAGGIPIGMGRQPNSAFGTRYNGALRNIAPKYLLSDLAAIKAKGGKVVLMLAGPENFFKDSDGHFSFTKWQARIRMYKNVNFTKYINDGTIIGHYLIDEPYDTYNWNGRPVTGATIEQMAKYSKSIWPTMTTIVRAEPGQIKWSGTYHYLDAAWAHFFNPRGILDPKTYIAKNVAAAKAMGLGLVVGLNFLHGAPPFKGPGKGGSPMTPSQIVSWGSALLASSYPCAFISYYYVPSYLERSGVNSAMSQLRNKAQNRPAKSCRGS